MFHPIPGTTVIGLGNKARHGKDTAASIISELAPGKVRLFGFGEELKAYARVALGMTTKDAPLLQRAGDAVRATDPLTLLRAVYHHIEEAKPTYAVIPDVRYPEEVEMIHTMGGYAIHVSRVNADGTLFVDPSRPADHPTETALDNFNGWDAHIEAQSGDIAGLRRQVRVVFNGIEDATRTVRTIKTVYVAGPFRAKSFYMAGQQDNWEIQRNIMRAMGLALEVWRLGAAALCPHANTCFFQNAAKDEVWLDGDLVLLAKCDAVIMTPDWQRSTGARAEHEYALSLGMPIFYNLATLKTWLDQSATLATLNNAA